MEDHFCVHLPYTTYRGFSVAPFESYLYSWHQLWGHRRLHKAFFFEFKHWLTKKNGVCCSFATLPSRIFYKIPSYIFLCIFFHVFSPPMKENGLFTEELAAFSAARGNWIGRRKSHLKRCLWPFVWRPCRRMWHFLRTTHCCWLQKPLRKQPFKTFKIDTTWFNFRALNDLFESNSYQVYPASSLHPASSPRMAGFQGESGLRGAHARVPDHPWRRLRQRGARGHSWVSGRQRGQRSCRHGVSWEVSWQRKTWKTGDWQVFGWWKMVKVLRCTLFLADFPSKWKLWMEKDGLLNKAS